MGKLFEILIKKLGAWSLAMLFFFIGLSLFIFAELALNRFTSNQNIEFILYTLGYLVSPIFVFYSLLLGSQIFYGNWKQKRAAKKAIEEEKQENKKEKKVIFIFSIGFSLFIFINSLISEFALHPNVEFYLYIFGYLGGSICVIYSLFIGIRIYYRNKIEKTNIKRIEVKQKNKDTEEKIGQKEKKSVEKERIISVVKSLNKEEREFIIKVLRGGKPVHIEELCVMEEKDMRKKEEFRDTLIGLWRKDLGTQECERNSKSSPLGDFYDFKFTIPDDVWEVLKDLYKNNPKLFG